MKTNQILFGLALLAAGLTISGCYTQFATNERDPYADEDQGYTAQDTSGASGYYDSRERFYSDYYVTAPTLTIGASFWDPWGYPGYGYGAWWCYNPWYNPYYPAYYPGYWPGGYAQMSHSSNSLMRGVDISGVSLVTLLSVAPVPPGVGSKSIHP